MFFESPDIHPTAIVSEGATLSSGVFVGPYCVVGPNVTLFENVHLVSHVCVDGITFIGKGTKVYPFASLGHAPQDLKYKGETSQLVIGEHVTIREYVTIHPGTQNDRMETRVGNHVLLMVGVHIAHDCIVEDHVIMANNATLGGHVHIGRRAIIGGLSAIQQFVHVGELAMIGGMSGVDKDVIPYGLVMGERSSLYGLNLIGLKRAGFSPETLQNLMNAYQTIFENKEGSLDDRLLKLSPLQEDDSISCLVNFVKRENRRPLCMPKEGMHHT